MMQKKFYNKKQFEFILKLILYVDIIFSFVSKVSNSDNLKLKIFKWWFVSENNFQRIYYFIIFHYLIIILILISKIKSKYFIISVYYIIVLLILILEYSLNNCIECELITYYFFSNFYYLIILQLGLTIVSIYLRFRELKNST